MGTTRRSRRSDLELDVDRLTDETVRRLGRAIRAARIRRRLTQAQLGERIGVSQSEISRFEIGLGSGTAIGTWLALAAVLAGGRGSTLARDWRDEPPDAGHLDVQELLLRLASAIGAHGRFELAVGRADPTHSVDVFVRDDGRRRLIVEEAWNSIGDIGAGARSFERKLAATRELAIAICAGNPYEVRGVWIVKATRRNRLLVIRYPEIFARWFSGSSRQWVEALTTGATPPLEPGLVWCDVAATRLSAWRRRYSDRDALEVLRGLG